MLEMLSSEYFTRGSRFFREISKIATMRRMPVFGWKGALALEILLLLSSSTHLPFNIFFFFLWKITRKVVPYLRLRTRTLRNINRDHLFLSFLFFFFFFTNQWGWIEEELFRSSCFTSFSPFRWNGENSFEKSAGNLRRLLSQNFYSLLSSRFLLSRGKEAAKIQRCHETIVWNTKVYW